MSYPRTQMALDLWRCGTVPDPKNTCPSGLRIGFVVGRLRSAGHDVARGNPERLLLHPCRVAELGGLCLELTDHMVGAPGSVRNGVGANHVRHRELRMLGRNAGWLPPVGRS